MFGTSNYTQYIIRSEVVRFEREDRKGKGKGKGKGMCLGNSIGIQQPKVGNNINIYIYICVCWRKSILICNLVKCPKMGVVFLSAFLCSFPMAIFIL